METIITLTTDFGLNDAYVAAIKGVILGINRDARIVDICHSISPQNVAQASFVLGTAYSFFPRRTIHMVVVDPGVGTERRAIIVRTPPADFIAPDNGVLSYALQPYITTSQEAGNINVELSPEVEAVAVTREEFWHSPVSPTFHGRDIFAPVAAWLSLDIQPETFGETISSVAVLPIPRPHYRADGLLIGHILHVDKFGNLVTDIRDTDLPRAGQSIEVEVKGHRVSGLKHTYAEGEDLLALIGSSGYLEIAFNGGSAASFLNAGAGDEVEVRLHG